MKLLVVLAGCLIALCGGEEIPTIPGDNSHYVEGQSRYIWMPDGHGVPHLVDLEDKVDEDLLNSYNTRNGADNGYWLYTRNNRYNPQFLVNGNANSIWNSNYNGNRPTKVVVHGWNNNGNSPMNPQITAAFLAVQDVNVIVVDWNRLANANYVSAAAGVPDVGRHIGNFLTFLFNTAGGNWNNLHLVGFSLGAHVVGNAGSQIGARAARVTGLDPAGPGWGSGSTTLNRNCGQYVECIHTDGRLLGIFNPHCDADFYPNGGMNPQPGCWASTCSHGRSTELYAATVQFNHLVGRQCNTLWDAELSNCNGNALNMGNAVVSKRGNGLFGLRTGSAWPF